MSHDSILDKKNFFGLENCNNNNNNNNNNNIVDLLKHPYKQSHSKALYSKTIYAKRCKESITELAKQS